MPMFRKKPVVIEAALFDGFRVGAPNPERPWDLLPGSCPEWFPAVVQEINPDNWRYVKEGEVFGGPLELYIGTLEGPHKASAGDWIIRGIKGELYPCKPDIFEAIYEPVASPPSVPAGE